MIEPTPPQDLAPDTSTEPEVRSETRSPLHCVTYLPRVRQEEGGVIRAVTDLCTVLAQQGHRVTLATLDASDVPAEWKRDDSGQPNVMALAPSTFSMFISRRSMAMFGQVIADADVVHLHEPWVPSNHQLARAARACGKPYVVTIHGMLDDWSMARRRLKKRLYLTLGGRRFLEQAARVHCTAEAESQQASKWFPQGKSVVLPLVFDLAAFHQLPGPKPAEEAFGLAPDGAPKILFLSRLHPKKGVENLIGAAAILHQRGLRFRLFLAGPGETVYCDQLRQQIARSQLDESVQFLGMVQGATKVSLYEACDLFVLPTSQENFGLVLTEAMACGTPVITTRGVDIWQELEQGGAKIVEQTPEAIATAIASLLADPEQLRRRGQQGRDFVFQWLDSRKVVHGYESTYRKVVSESRES